MCFQLLFFLQPLKTAAENMVGNHIIEISFLLADFYTFLRGHQIRRLTGLYKSYLNGIAVLGFFLQKFCLSLQFLRYEIDYWFQEIASLSHFLVFWPMATEHLINYIAIPSMWEVYIALLPVLALLSNERSAWLLLHIKKFRKFC